MPDPTPSTTTPHQFLQLGGDASIWCAGCKIAIGSVHKVAWLVDPEFGRITFHSNACMNLHGDKLITPARRRRFTKEIRAEEKRRASLQNRLRLAELRFAKIAAYWSGKGVSERVAQFLAAKNISSLKLLRSTSDLETMLADYGAAGPPSLVFGPRSKDEVRRLAGFPVSAEIALIHRATRQAEREERILKRDDIIMFRALLSIAETDDIRAANIADRALLHVNLSGYARIIPNANRREEITMRRLVRHKTQERESK